MAPRPRLLTAALLAFASTFAAAEPIVARLGRGTLASEVAKRHGVTLKAVTPDGRYAKFDVKGDGSVQATLDAMRKDRGLAVVELETQVRTVAEARPTLTKKGSTIPVVGDRASLQAANAEILQSINWDPTLANSAGRQVRIAILDTGLAQSAPGLWAKVDASKNFIENGRPAYDQPNGTDTSGEGIPDEAVGHGTVVAGIIDQVAPNCRFVITRVADSDGFATSWTILQAITYAKLQDAEVINISLAARERSLLVELAIREAELLGITVVASIGNDNTHDAYEPAGTSTVVTVSAVDLNGVKAPFSNWHSYADVAAPGTSVISRFWTGDGIQWSGTSFSAAFVSGAIGDCLRRRNRNLPLLVRLALQESGENIDARNPAYAGKLGRLLDIKKLDQILQRGFLGLL
ncbi:MAG: S8 family peptidase [Fimbriimonas sp.]